MKSLITRAQEKFANQISETRIHKIADSFMKVSEKPGEGLNSFAEKGIQAGILNNFAKIMDSELGQGVIHSDNYGPYVMEIWPVVTAWYPEFPLKDLISVQDMDKPLAYMFFSKLLAGTSKAPTVVGDVVETATGPRTIKGKYPTGEIYGEILEGSALEFDKPNTIGLLAYAPLNVSGDYLEKYKISVTTAAGTTEYIPLSIQGKVITFATITAPTVATGLTLDTETGLVKFAEGDSASASTVTKLVVNYVWNVDYAQEENIQKVVEDIEMIPMEARPRALAMRWTLFSEYLKKSQFGIDIREENTKRILGLLYQFQIRYILDTMYDYATGNNGTAVNITIPGSTTMSVDVKAQQVTAQLKDVANMIERASGRMEGNRIVCGRNFKSFVESLPNTLFQPTAQPAGFSAPREIGTFGTFKVYYDQERGDDEAFMTYRGSEWYDAAFYYGIFMPIVPTDAIALGVEVRESFVSMEAFKYHKKNCTVKLKVVNA